MNSIADLYYYRAIDYQKKVFASIKYILKWKN